MRKRYMVRRRRLRVPQHTRTHSGAAQRRVFEQRAEQQSWLIQQASVSALHGGCAELVVVEVMVMVVMVVVVVMVVGKVVGKSPMLVQVIPTELPSKVLPHELSCSQQNCTHGAVKLSALAVLQ